jgi:hypothetical protein
MIRKSRKKPNIQLGKGYLNELKNFIIESAIDIKTELNSSPLTVFTPDCDLFTDEHCFNFNDIHIENTLDEIRSEYIRNNYLYLRPYRGEKIFIIACGNNRFDCSNFTNKNIVQCELLDYNIYHNHRDAYTLDLTLVANPSIVADFNADLRLEKIPDNSFNFIFFEGGGNPEDNPHEIQRLLNRNTTSMCIGMTQGTYYVYSFWSDGEYFIS